ncbi:izumo sperm-egg fusion protein 1 isoform X1 [Hippocampus comes]|uniref:izumo sperm-egg fusion protein 1 isoform X1 n=2 Tax=Hippocampus comes TaxID=109280 RepID=UPI00094F1C6F|nr:PREDICTED: izumo sperm-egg fusion protein 1 isoform X1 [Hippocampus comes]
MSFYFQHRSAKRCAGAALQLRVPAQQQPNCDADLSRRTSIEYEWIRGRMLQWWAVILMLCCNTVSEACLQCDKEILNTHEDFSLSASTPQKQIEREKIIDNVYSKYKEASRELKGIIDPTTLYRVKTEYLSEFNRFLDADYSGLSQRDFIHIIEQGKKILVTHLKKFIADKLCPNKCGLLQRRVMDCMSCKYKIYSCPSPSGKLDCGEYQIEAEEGGHAFLDCFQPWHSLVFGSLSYTWTSDTKVNGPNSGYKIVMEESSMVLNQLHLRDQGTYRCSLTGQDGTEFYRVAVHLTVTRAPTETYRSSVSLPALTPEDEESLQHDRGALVPLMAVVTALSLAGCLIFIVVIGKMMIQRRKTSATQRSRVEEENNTFTSVWARWRAQ